MKKESTLAINLVNFLSSYAFIIKEIGSIFINNFNDYGYYMGSLYG